MGSSERYAGSALSAEGNIRDEKSVTSSLRAKAEATRDATWAMRFVVAPMVLSYLNGDQWLERGSADSLRFWTDNEQVQRNRRVTINLCRPRHRQFVGLTSRNKPGWIAQPEDDVAEAHALAHVNTLFLDHLARDGNIAASTYLAMNFTGALGSAYRMPYFDPGRGAPIFEPEVERDILTDEPVDEGEATGGFLSGFRKLFNPKTRRPVVKKTELSGRFGYNTYTPLEVWGPAGARTPFVDTWTFAQVSDVLDLGEVQRLYGKKAESLAATTEPSEWGLDYVGALSSIRASSLEITNQSLAAPREGVVVWRYFEPASTLRGYELGREVHWSGDVVLYDGPLKVPEIGIPLHGTYLDWDPGMPFCRGLVEILIDVQDFLNRIFTRMMRSVQLGNDPPLLVPMGSGITEERLREGAKRLIHFDGLRGQPRWLLPAPLPAQLFTLPGMIEAIADRLTGMQPLARGELARGLPSGVAIQIIQEAMESVFASFAQLSAHSMGRLGHHSLLLARHAYAKRPHVLVQILGEDKSSRFLRVPPGDLGRVSGVQVSEDSLLPRLAAARKAQIREDHQAGIFGNPQDPAVQAHVRRQLDEPTTIKTSLPGEEDRALAEHEDLELLEYGTPSAAIQQRPERAQDNHYIHQQQHALETRSKGYSQRDPRMVQEQQAHIAWHGQQIAAMEEQKRQEQLKQFREVETIKAQMSAFRTQQAMISNIMSARAAKEIRDGKSGLGDVSDVMPDLGGGMPGGGAGGEPEPGAEAPTA